MRDNIFGDNGWTDVGFYYSDEDYQYLPFTIAPGQHLKNLVIRMRPPKPKASGLITGRVIDANGKGVGNVEVALYKPGSLDKFFDKSTRTDDRGEYRVYGLKPGQYILGYSAGLNIFQVSKPTSSTIPATFYPGVGDISSSEIIVVENEKEVRAKDLVLGLAPLGKLRVHILNRGEPAKEGLMGTGDGFGSVHIDAGADFWQEYSPIRPGRLPFVVKWTNPSRTISVYFTEIIFDGRDQSLEVDLSGIHGVLSIQTFVEQADGSTVPYKSSASPNVVLSSRATDHREVNTRSASQSLYETNSGERMTLGPDGSADFTDLIVGTYDLGPLDLPPGLYLTSASQGQRNALNDGVNISDHPSILEIHLRQDAAVFRGNILDIQGLPAHGAFVFLIPEIPQAQSHIGWFIGRADQNGRFEIPGIGPGKYRAYAASGVVWGGSGKHILSYLDPQFVDTFKDSAIPISIGPNEELSQNLNLLAH
jgi:hypothetical protein